RRQPNVTPRRRGRDERARTGPDRLDRGRPRAALPLDEGEAAVRRRAPWAPYPVRRLLGRRLSPAGSRLGSRLDGTMSIGITPPPPKTDRLLRGQSWGTAR